MPRSLSLSAYLALHRSAGRRPETSLWPRRPNGGLVWVHGADPAQTAAVRTMTRRLREDGDAVAVLLTGQTADPPSVEHEPGLIAQPSPDPTRQGIRGFRDHWRPDMLLWMQPTLDPVLLVETDTPPLRRIMLDVTARGLSGSVGGWLPGMTAALLDRFDVVIANDAAAATRLQRSGLPPERIETLGPLDDGTAVLSCRERDRADLARILHTRPVWLAADVPLGETPAMIAAQLIAGRRTHRLMQIIAPRLPEDGPAMAQQVHDAGLEVALRSAGQNPTEATQVFVTDKVDELGLWYRLAPITYLGGTLTDGGQRHPFEPAALGSALLHGAQTGPHRAIYTMMDRAGASREIASPTELGEAVEGLLNPDRAAAMAHAAWAICSTGAEATNRVVDLIRRHLDRVH